MTYFQRTTFHNFRFQRNTIPRRIQGFLLLNWPWRKDLFHSVPSVFLSRLPLSLLRSQYRRWHSLCRLCAPASLPALQTVGSSKAPCRDWAQTCSTCYSKILIWILVPDIHSFIKSKHSRQLMLYFFYYSNLLLTMKKMMSFPGCDKGLILYAVKAMSQQFLCPWGQSIQQFWK